MKLKGFRVTDFRSVKDSGWVEAQDVTALIGTNESGKTNLLVPLWKLNPAKDGDISPLADYPRKRYGEIRDAEVKPVFIDAHFDVGEELAARISELTKWEPSKVRTVSVKRRFCGTHLVTFPDAVIDGTPTKDQLTALLDDATNIFQRSTATGGSVSARTKCQKAIDSAKNAVQSLSAESVDLPTLTSVVSTLEQAGARKAAKSEDPALQHFGLIVADLAKQAKSFDRPQPGQNQKVTDLILETIPTFVYYSNYGNLDSEIYLPHVIENLKRKDLGLKEEAKARTLKVLFEFVNLQPNEIRELGKDFQPQGQQDQQQARAKIEEIAKKKKEREVLLQSASTKLTSRFREWWKQGEYRFRLQADGDHFRIWVSDDRRPEEIELEGRSAGLQWFFSFYLVFLVESEDEHQDAILLLDEPGLSLHPIAQEDLSKFFDGLSVTNQIVYTTHSPFMVDSNHLDRVNAVYVDDEGCTRVSPDLRASERQSSQRQSIYAVNAALGLSVSRTLLLGCQNVIVEGPSDQFYLSAIKNYLIGQGLIKPDKEIVFIPAWGVRGIKAVTSIIAGPNDDLPFVLLDGDAAGVELADNLRKQLYSGAAQRVLTTDQFSDVTGSEIEDLWPTDFIAPLIAKMLRSKDAEADFDEIVDSAKPLVPQIEAYASTNEIELDSPGWKVELSKDVKKKLLHNPSSVPPASAYVTQWVQLFEMIIG